MILPAIITSIFLLTLISYYILLFIPGFKPPVQDKFSSITVIIPAHNEEKYIRQSVQSVKNAYFYGEKQIIVVDDGSIDRTYSILKGIRGIEIIRTRHSGKSASLNKAIKNASGEIIAVVDGDSSISKQSLAEMAKEIGRKNTAAASCVVRIKNKKNVFTLWPHIEQLYNSLMRSILSKVGANIVTPGPLAIYRKDILIDNGGFSTDGFSEDIDVTIRLIRQGYRIGFTENAISETNFPTDVKNFLRQRTRFARGMINIFKRHLQIKFTIIDLYTLPIYVFAYVQAIIMGLFTVYQITSGYITYFYSKGIVFNLSVLSFFFDWFSLVGFLKWTYTVITGGLPLELITIVGIFATFLTYPLYLVSMWKYDKILDFYNLFALFFIAPFWWFLMVIYIICIPEIIIRKQYNIWKKNE